MKKTIHTQRSRRIELPPLRSGLAVLLLGLVLFPGEIIAVGLRLPNQDPEGIARGNAFAATADNPSAIYYNPAGISQLAGDQIQAGLYLISANTKYSSSTGDAQTDAGLQAVPQLYYTHAFENTPFSAGLGIYAPYGLGMDWGDSPPFVAIAQKGKLLYAAINPVIAWRLHETLSFAIGPTINYCEADFQNASFKFKGDDFAFGFNAGLLWHPIEQWSFGLKFHSATDMDLSGNSEFPAFPGTSTATEGQAHFPYFIVAGVSYRPTTNWNIEVNVDWTDWDSLNTVNFDRQGVGPLTVVPFVFNYQSSWMYEFGVTRQLGNGWFVSVGYIYSENSVPDADYNPIVPDSNLSLGSIGFGHRGQRWNWAIGYHFAHGNRDVTSANNPLADGNYKTFNNAFNLSATYKF